MLILSFCELVWDSVALLITRGVWSGFFYFKSSLGSPADTEISWIAESKDVSSTNNSTLDDKLSHKSLIKIRNNNRPNIDPCGTPALTLVQADIWLLRATLSFSIT